MTLPDPPVEMSPPRSFVAELKRRRVVQVAVAYAGASWALLDLAERALLIFSIAESLFRSLVIAAVAGFPVVLVLAWLFDLTRKGIERTPDAPAAAGSDGLPARYSRQLVVSAAIVILAMTGLGWRYMPSDRAHLEPDQVTVLPFDNQTGGLELDHLGVIAADHIVDGLGHVEAFKVIEANVTVADTARPEGAPPGDPAITPVQAVAERTHSALVVTGSYFRSGDDITFRARVHDAERGEVAFSTEPVRANADDPMADLERLREGLLGYFGLLSSRTSEEAEGSRQLVGGRAPTYAAYKEFALGIREFQARRYARSAEQFELAASIDTTFHGALWRAATARMNMQDWAGVDSLIRRMEPMRSELVPTQHAFLDWARSQVEGDLPGVHDAAVRMAEFVPTSPIAYLAGMAANDVDRPREAVELFSRYDLEWGWRWVPIWELFASARHRLGQHRRELWLVREGREWLPEAPALQAKELTALAGLGRDDEVEERIGELGPFHFRVSVAWEVEAHGAPEAAQRLFARILTDLEELPLEEQQMFQRPFLRAQALAALGRDDEALPLLEALVEAAPDSATYRGFLGVVAARSGDVTSAEEAISILSALDIAYRRGSNVREQARIAAALGDTERAIRFLDTAFEQGAADWENLHVHPAYAAVRDHPAFVAYMEPRG